MEYKFTLKNPTMLYLLGLSIVFIPSSFFYVYHSLDLFDLLYTLSAFIFIVALNCYFHEKCHAFPIEQLTQKKCKIRYFMFPPNCSFPDPLPVNFIKISLLFPFVSTNFILLATIIILVYGFADWLKLAFFAASLQAMTGTFADLYWFMKIKHLDNSYTIKCGGVYLEVFKKQPKHFGLDHIPSRPPDSQKS